MQPLSRNIYGKMRLPNTAVTIQNIWLLNAVRSNGAHFKYAAYPAQRLCEDFDPRLEQRFLAWRENR